eukprot:55875-Eustigmatos_ZCMA.PRE.1
MRCEFFKGSIRSQGATSPFGAESLATLAMARQCLPVISTPTHPPQRGAGPSLRIAVQVHGVSTPPTYACMHQRTKKKEQIACPS